METDHRDVVDTYLSYDPKFLFCYFEHFEPRDRLTDMLTYLGASVAQR